MMTLLGARDMAHLDIAIEVIRVASNELEVMESVPDDFLENSYWNGMP